MRVRQDIDMATKKLKKEKVGSGEQVPTEGAPIAEKNILSVTTLTPLAQHSNQAFASRMKLRHRMNAKVDLAYIVHACAFTHGIEASVDRRVHACDRVEHAEGQ